MAQRYDEYRGEPHPDDRSYSREPRRFINRAADEVRSWFGNDAERRPYDEHDHSSHGHAQMQEGHHHEGRHYDGPRHERMESSRNWTPDRAETPGRWSGEHDYGYSGSTMARTERWSRDDGGADMNDRWSPRRSSSLGPDERWAATPPTSSRPGSQDWRYGERWSASNWTQADQEHRQPRGYYEDDRGRVHQFAHSAGTNFAGRGPKGYRRSDERIREEICERLTEDWRIDASEVEVTVANGEVTLAGEVRRRDDKRHAEDLVESISGVRDVNNELRVSRREQGDVAASPQAPGSGVR